MRSLKERIITMPSEQKRTQCPTLTVAVAASRYHRLSGIKLAAFCVVPFPRFFQYFLEYFVRHKLAKLLFNTFLAQLIMFMLQMSLFLRLNCYLCVWPNNLICWVRTSFFGGHCCYFLPTHFPNPTAVFFVPGENYNFCPHQTLYNLCSFVKRKCYFISAVGVEWNYFRAQSDILSFCERLHLYTCINWACELVD